MALPTMSVRVSPEHHGLIRDIATALRARPELADVLRDVLQVQQSGPFTERDTDVLQTFQEKLVLQEKTTLSLMAMVENIADRLKVLERPDTDATPTTQPRPAAGKRKPRTPFTDNMKRKARDMRDEGRTYKQIANEIGVVESSVYKYLSKR